MLALEFSGLNSNLKFSTVKICVVVGYGPNERYGEERDRFWNMDRTLDSIRNGYRLSIMGDLNR